MEEVKACRLSALKWQTNTQTEMSNEGDCSHYTGVFITNISSSQLLYFPDYKTYPSIRCVTNSLKKKLQIKTTLLYAK